MFAFPFARPDKALVSLVLEETLLTKEREKRDTLHFVHESRRKLDLIQRVYYRGAGKIAMETLKFDRVWSGGCRLEVVDGDVGTSSSITVPTCPTAPPPTSDVLPQFAKVPRILNPGSTREFVIGYVRKSAR